MKIVKDMNSIQPIYWKTAIIVFVASLYFIKLIRSNDTSKIIDIKHQILIIKDKDAKEIERYPLNKLQAIELLKFRDDDYIHYELNFRFNEKRINLYANKDDLLPYLYAKDLSKRLHKPIIKIETEK